LELVKFGSSAAEIAFVIAAYIPASVIAATGAGGASIPVPSGEVVVLVAAVPDVVVVVVVLAC
jgi:hypothetical protein